VTRSTRPSPDIAPTVVFRAISTFLSAIALSCIILLARSSPRLCTRRTLLANFVRNVASSIAESPPPTTTISLPLKNGPSHVAQYDTPLPASSPSPGTPSLRGLAPVAMITALAVYSSEAVITRNGRRAKSTLVTSSSTIAVPILSACARMSSMRSGPIIASRNPG